MNLPTQVQCKHIIDVMFRVPPNIIAHSVMVNRVAILIAEKMKERGHDVNVDLVDRASILHDVLKIIEIDNALLMLTSPVDGQVITVKKKDRDIWRMLKEKYVHLGHEAAAYHAFKEKFPEMAEVIRRHGYIDLDSELGPRTWEEKIVNYADKRVKHHEIVLLKERFEDGHKRYAHKAFEGGLGQDKMKEIDKKYNELEKEIFGMVGFSPDNLKKMIESQDQ